MIEREIAPAKINLFLHVGGARADGYHEIESLFVFADDGDVVRAAPAADISLEISGPFAAALAACPPSSNLVWRAAAALKEAADVRAGAAITLEKRLPVAAGIGGGSADAAAALRALCRLWRVDVSESRLADIAFGLGADVPACLARRPVFVSGAGEAMRAGPRLPPLWACLVNPGVETPTGPVFAAFDRANPSPGAPSPAPAGALFSYGDVAAYLRRTRNDLEPFTGARRRAIAVVADFLAECPGCLLARMSGSGATVFGLFASREAAWRATRRSTAFGWWSMAAKVECGAMPAGSGECNRNG